MFSHIMVGANDINASKAFYDAVLGALGYAPGNFDDKGRVFYFTETGVFAISEPIDGEDASHGNGSTIAPSLVTKLQEIEKERFMDVVINGYSGEIGVMPPWKENPNVMKHIQALYAYILARSDGVLPAGKLQRFDR